MIYSLMNFSATSSIFREASLALESLGILTTELIFLAAVYCSLREVLLSFKACSKGVTGARAVTTIAFEVFFIVGASIP